MEDLYPVNYNGTTIYLTSDQIAQYEGLGLFGKKRRKKVESGVAKANQLSTQNAAMAQQFMNAYQQKLPQVQSELNSAKAMLKAEEIRTGTALPKGLAIGAFLVSLGSFGIVAYNKFIKKSKRK